MLRYLPLILLLCSCSWSNVAVNTNYGQATAVEDTAKVEAGESYTLKTISVDLIEKHEGWEHSLGISFTDHLYHSNDEEGTTISLGTKLHITKKLSCFIFGVGAGFRFTSQTEDNKWLADSYLLGDLSACVGVEKKFDNFDVRLVYVWQHLSAPWKDDRGVNYDVVQFGIIFPWEWN